MGAGRWSCTRDPALHTDLGRERKEKGGVPLPTRRLSPGYALPQLKIAPPMTAPMRPLAIEIRTASLPDWTHW